MLRFKAFEEYTDSLAKNANIDRVKSGGTADKILWMGDLIAALRKSKYVEIWNNDDYRDNISDPMYTFTREDLEKMKVAYHSKQSEMMLPNLKVVINKGLSVFDCHYDAKDDSQYFFFSEDGIDMMLQLLDENVNEKYKTPALSKEDILQKTPKAKGVTLRKDKKGYYVHTHRARSKSYRSPKLIPTSAIEFIETTG